MRQKIHHRLPQLQTVEKFKQLERRKSQNQLSNYNRSTVECIITAATRHYDSRQQHTDSSWFDMQKQSCLIIPNWQTQTQTMHHDTRPNAKQWPCTCMIVCNSKVSNSNPAWPYVQATTQLQLQLTVVGATVIDQCESNSCKAAEILIIVAAVNAAEMQLKHWLLLQLSMRLKCNWNIDYCCSDKLQSSSNADEKLIIATENVSAHCRAASVQPKIDYRYRIGNTADNQLIEMNVSSCARTSYSCKAANTGAKCTTGAHIARQKIANKSSMSWTEHQRMVAEISEKQELQWQRRRDRTLPNRVGSLSVWTDKNTIATWTVQVVESITYNHQNSNNQVKMKALQTLTHSTQFHLHLNGQLDTTILTWIMSREVGSGII